MRSASVPLRNQFEIDAAGEDHLFQQLVLAHVAALVRSDLSGRQQQAESEVVNTHVVADGVQALDAFFHQRANQVFRDAAQSEAANHDGGAVVDIVNRLIGVGHYFIHAHRICVPTGLYRGESYRRKAAFSPKLYQWNCHHERASTARDLLFSTRRESESLAALVMTIHN